MNYFYLVLFTVALVLVYFAIQTYRGSQAFLTRGIHTEAEVVKLVASRSDNGSTYAPVFRYTDRKGQTHSYKSTVSSKPAAYSVGNQVPIIYDPETFKMKTLTYWGLYRWTIILLCAASPMLVISVGYFLYVRG